MKRIVTCILACIIFTSSIVINITAEENLELGDYIILGKYQGKDIVWRYVADDENGKLFLSDKVLCEKSFDSVGEIDGIETKGSHALNGNRQIMSASWKDGEIVSYQSGGSNYWGDSNIRSWLTSSANAGEVQWLCDCPPIGETAKEKGFLHSDNFSDSEKTLIKTVYLNNYLDRADKALAIKGSKAGLEIDYKNRIAEVLPETMFLLDIDQIMDIQASSLASYLTLDTPWWTKTPYTGYTLSVKNEYSSIYSVCVKKDNEEILFDDRWIDYTDYERSDFPKGVRPAFYLNEEKTQILSGSGTKDDPYVLDGKKDKTGLTLGDYITLGKYNGEDIVWRYVLDDENGKMFISDSVLCEKSYIKTNGGRYNSEQWAGSSIHYWLNSINFAETLKNVYSMDDIVEWEEDGFLSDSNFTDTEKLMIKSVRHKCKTTDTWQTNGHYPGYNSNWDLWDKLILSDKYFDYEFEDYQLHEYDMLPGNTVIDSVFLPDVKEVLAIYENFGDYINTGSTWWLRTPELDEKVENYHFMAVKSADNKSSFVEKKRGFEFTHMDKGESAGIRPAFYLYEENVQIISGDGSKNTPFILDGKCHDGLQLGDYITLGIFEGEDILWRYVAEDKKGKLFVSERVLTNMSHGENLQWKDCDIRYFLRNEFFTEANFKSEDMKAVKEVGLETANYGEHWKWVLYPSNYTNADAKKTYAPSTTDVETMFLLNYNQIVNIYDNYAVLGDYLRRVDDKDKRIRSIAYYSKDISYYSEWWLRDCADYEYINHGDSYYYKEGVLINPTDPYFEHYKKGSVAGVRPAFYLNDDEVYIKDGVGTKSKPYIIKGKEPILFEENGLFGYKDENGSIIIPAKYLKAGEFTNEAALVILPENPYMLRYISPEGNYLFDKAFYAANNFNSGYALTLFNEKGEYRYINKQGEYVGEIYTYAEDFKDGLSRVILNGKEGVIDTNFNFYPDEINEDYSLVKEHKGYLLKFFANEEVIYERVYDKKVEVKEVKEEIYKVTEGITTVYIDVKEPRISEEYYYLLYAGEDYIVFESGYGYNDLSVTDIFDKEKVYYIVKDLDVGAAWGNFIYMDITDGVMHVKYKDYVAIDGVVDKYELEKHIPLTDELKP